MKDHSLVLIIAAEAILAAAVLTWVYMSPPASLPQKGTQQTMQTAMPLEATSGTGTFDTHTSQAALDWSGTYMGILPCADCEGLQTVITLNPDNTFTTQSRYNGKSQQVFTESGAFTWQANGNIISLNYGTSQQLYQVAENKLIHLDADGNRITGPLAQHFILAKKPLPQFTNTVWQLQALNQQSLPADAQRPFIIFQANNRISGFTGCNQANGNYSLQNNSQLSIAQLASTRMACINNPQLEEQFSTALGHTTHMQLSNNQLILLDKNATPLASFSANYFN